MTNQDREEFIKSEQKKQSITLVKKYLQLGIDFKTAKKAAKIYCLDIGEKLPSINDTPPIHRKSEDNYGGYWSYGVSHYVKLLKSTEL